MLRNIKGQATDWNKIVTMHLSKKRPVPRIYREILQLNNSNTNLKMGKKC